MVIKKRELKVRTNISLSRELKEEATKYARERYNTSLSSIITAHLNQFVELERKKKPENKNQGSLI